MRCLFLLLLATSMLGACGDDDPGFNPDLDAPGRFGDSTSAVVIVNPVINEGSTTSIESGDARGGISIEAGALPAVFTNSSGLAVIEDLPLGTVPLKFNTGTITLDVIEEKELYDVIVAYRPDGVT